MFTYRSAEDGSIDRQERVGGAVGTQHGGDSTDDECRVVDEETIGPRTVRHPTSRHPGQRVGDADDGEQEGRLLVRYAQSDGVVREIDERHEETYDDMKTLATVMVIAVVRLHAGTTACGEWDKCMW